MAKRFLLSVVPSNFKMTQWNDELAFAFQTHQLSEMMVEQGLTPYSALELFRQINGGYQARTIKRQSFLILGEVVSERAYREWKDALGMMKLSTALQLMIDNVRKQDGEWQSMDRLSRMMPEIMRDLRYWKLCNTGNSVCEYRPELKRGFRPDLGGSYGKIFNGGRESSEAGLRDTAVH